MKALEQITALLGLLSIVQGYEFLRIHRAYGADGVWTWPVLSKELPAPLAVFLKENSFLFLNLIRVFTGVAAINWPGPGSLGILLFIHVLTMLRWLGSYNGGSDYMASLLLLFTLIAMLAPNTFGAVCLWYITFQLCLSYFRAGWVKFKNAKWRNGTALPAFILTPVYQRGAWLRWAFAKRPVALLLSWVTIVFELLFPLAVLDQRLAAVFMAAAFLFHLGNAYVFGLNRFVFAWVAAYPALYWCAGYFSKT